MSDPCRCQNGLLFLLPAVQGGSLHRDQPSLILVFIRGKNLSVTAILVFIAAVLSQAVVVVVLRGIEHPPCQNKKYLLKQLIMFLRGIR